MIEHELSFPLPLPWSGQDFQTPYIGTINYEVDPVIWTESGKS